MPRIKTKRIRKMNKHLLLLSCICTLVVFILYLIWNSFKIIYASYDDYPFVVFLTHGDNIFLYIGVFLSSFLFFLQSLLPSISVYPIFLVIISLVSFVALDYVLLKKFSLKLGILFSILFNFIFINVTVIRLQYTEIAGLTCLASSAIFIVAIQFEKRKTNKVLQIIVGILLGVIGSQLRFDAFIPCSAFTALYCICVFFRNYSLCKEKSWKDKARLSLKKTASLLLSMGMIILCVFTLNKASDFLKTNSNFAEHLAYTEARTLVQDYQIASYAGNESFYCSQDVYSEDDYILLTCFKVDKDVYTTDKMNIIAKYATDNFTGKTNIYFEYFRALKNRVAVVFGDEFFVYPVVLICILLFLGLLFFLFRIRNRIKFFPLIALCAGWGIFFIYIKRRYDFTGDGLLMLFVLAAILIAIFCNRYQYIHLALFNPALIIILNYMAFSRLPFRAEYTVVVPALYLLLLLFYTEDFRINIRNIINKVPNIIGKLACVCLSVVLIFLIQFKLGIFSYSIQESKYDNELVTYINDHSDSLFFYDCYGCDLVDHAKNNPFVLPDFPENTIQYGGWPAASFFYDRQLKSYNIEKLYEEMINNSQRFFVITKDDVIDGRHYLDRIKSYYNTHYSRGKEIVFKEVYSSKHAWVFSVIEKT